MQLAIPLCEVPHIQADSVGASIIIIMTTNYEVISQQQPQLLCSNCGIMHHECDVVHFNIEDAHQLFAIQWNVLGTSSWEVGTWYPGSHCDTLKKTRICHLIWHLRVHPPNQIVRMRNQSIIQISMYFISVFPSADPSFRYPSPVSQMEIKLVVCGKWMNEWITQIHIVPWPRVTAIVNSNAPMQNDTRLWPFYVGLFKQK